MNLLKGLEKAYYIEKYTIQSLFSFDVSPFVQVFQFEKGDFIIREGSAPEYLFYMVEGKAKLYVSHKNGKVSLINFLTPPIFMGEIELLNEEKYSKSIQTSSKCICLGISIEKCKEKLLADAHFLKYLCIFLSNKSTADSTKYTKHQAYPLENKLAEFILLSLTRRYIQGKAYGNQRLLRCILPTFTAYICSIIRSRYDRKNKNELQNIR